MKCWQNYSKDSRVEFTCFSFHVGLLFLSIFRLSNRTPKITRILTLYQANASVKKTISWSLYRNSRQASAADAMAYWWKRRHSNVESPLLIQEDKPQSHRTVREISREAGDPSIISFADYLQRSVSQLAAWKGALNSWLKRTACTRYFRYAVWETITW